MITKLEMKNFRQHEDLTITFKDGLNVIRGANEAGKSTLIEAILYALFGAKSLRDTLTETVTWGKKETELAVYEKEMEAGLLKGYEVLYNKGLGGLATEDYNQMLHNQKLVKFELKDATDIEAVNVWFSKNVEQRKELILIDSEEDVA